MDKKTKILLLVLAIITAASVGYTFYKTFVKQDFQVVNTGEALGTEEEDGAIEDETAGTAAGKNTAEINSEETPGADEAAGPEESAESQE